MCKRIVYGEQADIAAINTRRFNPKIVISCTKLKALAALSGMYWIALFRQFRWQVCLYIHPLIELERLNVTKIKHHEGFVDMSDEDMEIKSTGQDFHERIMLGTDLETSGHRLAAKVATQLRQVDSSAKRTFLCIK